MAKPFLTHINSRPGDLKTREKRSRGLMRLFNAIEIPRREIANALNETIREYPMHFVLVCGLLLPNDVN